MFFIFLIISEVNISEKYYLKGSEYLKNREYEKEYKCGVKFKNTSYFCRISLLITQEKFKKYEDAKIPIEYEVFLIYTLLDSYCFVEHFYYWNKNINEEKFPLKNIYGGTNGKNEVIL